MLRHLVLAALTFGAVSVICAPSTSPSLAPTPAQKKFPMTMLMDGSGNPSGISLSCFMDPVNNVMQMEIMGPADRWFGIAFGNNLTQSPGTDAVLYTEGKTTAPFTAFVHDWWMVGPNMNNSNHDATQNWGFTGHMLMMNGMMRHITIKRQIRTSDANFDYQIDPHASALNVMWLKADSPTFYVDVGGYLSGAVSKTFMISPYFPTAAPTPYTYNHMATNTSSCMPGKMFTKSVTVLTVDMSMGTSPVSAGFTAHCDNRTMEMTLMGPSGKWFGILFGTTMIGADAVVYTTGKDGTDPLALYDYMTLGHDMLSVTKDVSQDWTTKKVMSMGGNVMITATRPFRTNDLINDYQFDYNHLVFDVMWAIGPMNMLMSHSSNNHARSAMQFDLPLPPVVTPDFCPMTMWFHWTTDECLLFDTWRSRDIGTFMLFALFLFVLCLLREVALIIQVSPQVLGFIIRNISTRRMKQQLIEGMDVGRFRGFSTEDFKNEAEKERAVVYYVLIFWDGFWYTVGVGIGYLLMLVFMTFNNGWCLTVLLGLWFARYVFKRQLDKMITGAPMLHFRSYHKKNCDCDCCKDVTATASTANTHVTASHGGNATDNEQVAEQMTRAMSNDTSDDSAKNSNSNGNEKDGLYT